MICPHPSWVEPVNRAFTPTADLVAYNKRVRAVFAEAVASGTAAVPLDGRMIDVPVDEWAKVVIAMDEACTSAMLRKGSARAVEINSRSRSLKTRSGCADTVFRRDRAGQCARWSLASPIDRGAPVVGRDLALTHVREHMLMP